MNELLFPNEPIAVVSENEASTSPIVFVSDHAGKRIPERLGSLGLEEPNLSRHIAWDIGIHEVTSIVARSLDGTYIYQPYSRLVVDCNRRPGIDQSIVHVSDGTVIPGNQNLTPREVLTRENEILRPYHTKIESVLDQRRAAGRATVLFTMHSCTPALTSEAVPRPWHIGVISYQDWRIGQALIDLLNEETDLTVGKNEPYSVNMEVDYTIPLHGEGRGLPYVEIEIRQDLISNTTEQKRWASLLALLIPRVLERSGVLAK